MKKNVTVITVATADLDAARRFYVDALGWTPFADVPEEIIFFEVAQGLLLGLFEANKFNQDLATGLDHSAVSGMVLAHNVRDPDEVHAVVSTMAAAGGTVLKKPQLGKFGGIFHAHVQDPNNIIWEIAHNPAWPIDENGTATFPGQ